MLLYHAGYDIIQKPDIRYGRSNADFGQGFYTTKDGEFARRWARERKGCTTYVNTYTLDTAGLLIHRFERDEAWFDYIFGNRAGRKDALAEADVIIGPIASDTIYDTMGIITSGLLGREASLRLLQLGSTYEQTVIKTERAASQLKWLEAKALEKAELDRFRALIAKEEEAYLALFSEAIERL